MGGYCYTEKNISKLFTQLDVVNEYIKLLAATTGSDISHLLNQLEAVKGLAIIEQAEINKSYCGDGVWYCVAYLNMIPHSSAHHSGESTTPVNSELVEDQILQLEVVLPSFSLVIIYIVRYVEE